MRPSFRSFAAFILSACVAVSASAQAVGSTAPAPESEAPAVPQLSEQQMLEVFGWMTGMRFGLNQLGLSDEEGQAFMRGLDSARQGLELDINLEAVGPQISAFMQAKYETRMAELKAEAEAASKVFWEELKANENVKVTTTGLGYEIARPGNDRRPAATDRVQVHYTGTLLNGMVFDSSIERGPYETGLNEVIPGWTEGLQLIGEGGAIRLFVPPSLAYGDYGSGDIPPGATLIFDIDLLAVATPEAAEEPTVVSPVQP